MRIKNFEQLAADERRKTALKIIEEGFNAIRTETAVRKAMQRFDRKIVLAGSEITVNQNSSVFLVSVGKCGVRAALEAEKILGELIYKGVVVDIYEGKFENPNIETYAGDHPFASERNISATRRLISLLSETTENDLVISFISGGGSALLCQPDNMTCVEEREVIDMMFKKGASIEKVNTVRKHLSLARGGYLAKYAFPAKVVSLIFSDVPGNSIEFIASGPTAFDSTSMSDAKRVIEEYGVSETYPFIEKALIETPKENRFFTNVTNTVIVSNSAMLAAMKEAAENLGYEAKIMTDKFSGNARHIGAGIANNLKSEKPDTFLLYGGESTVVVKGKGRGGRNQEIALSAMRFADDSDIIIAVASDGIDNGRFAGGICDAISIKNAAELNMNVWDYLNDNNSSGFFEKTGDFLETGQTGSNVADIVLAAHFNE